MGIKQLSKLIGDHASGSIKESTMKNYFDRIIAIDASMALYQFMIAIRSDGNVLTNEEGEVTSHLQGMFSRTIHLLESGLKPVYVFDGKPPKMKSDELAKRKEKSTEAKAELAKAEEEGNAEAAEKFAKRTVRVSKEQCDDARKLLSLMGVPCILAESEAEATCAALCRAGKVFATGTEDMDALTFGTPVLLRHLHTPASRKQPIVEYNMKAVLEGLELTMDEFIDLCILCGCDYCGTIRGIGPGRALTLIKKHRTIEAILKNIDTKKYPVPEDFDFVAARELFKNPEVTDPSTVELKWTPPDEEALIQFMCKEKGFNEQRIQNGIEKLKKCRKSSGQKRLENFFGISTAAKRKAPETETTKGGAKKKAKPAPKKK